MAGNTARRGLSQANCDTQAGQPRRSQANSAAQTTARIPVVPHITATVPTARSINPVTGANWEGVGVAPDLPVAAEDALEAALAHLRTHLG
ncbi:hypothetical protein ACIHEI_34360 [Kitasatospora sp. NPDC051984]|uniref:hypothetical protein n=1 Tax=Kitasatospora sp. NPDC051984 TaxID=3364059 RepID=UPI0037C94B16